MIEAEIKLAVNSEKVREGLESMGFVFVDEVEETDTYFNSEQRNIADRGEALRLRNQVNLTTGEEISYLTFKGKKLDTVTATRKELETTVESADVMQTILESLGYYAVIPVMKTRRSYALDEITACLDTVEGLGEFLELEILIESDEMYDDAISRISDVLDSLGYSLHDTTNVSYLTMLQAKLEAEAAVDET